MSDQSTTIEIPDRIAQDLAARCEGTDFESVDAYAARALDELLAALDRAEAGGVGNGEAAPADDRGEGDAPDGQVADRLESLGYL